MTCSEADAQLEDFWEGTLEASAEEAVRDHLGGCKACRRRLSGLNAVDRRLRTAVKGLGGPPPGLAARVMARIAAESAPRTVRIRVLPLIPARAIFAAAAALLVVASVWTVVMQGGLAGPGAEPPPASADGAAARFHEPDPAAPLAMGKPFAIGADGRPGPAEGAGTLRITRVVRGVPVLLVEAFPEETSREKESL